MSTSVQRARDLALVPGLNWPQLWLLCLLLAVAAIPTRAAAATMLTGEPRHALVIGNDRYANLVPLANARSDATAVHQVLKDSFAPRGHRLACQAQVLGGEIVVRPA